MYNKHPLFTVEEYGEWRMEVYEDFVLSVDFFEEFAEIVFLGTQHL